MREAPGPVTAGSLIQRSFRVFRTGFVPFFTLALIFYTPIVVLQLTGFGSAGEDVASLAAGPGLILLIAHVLLMPIASAAVVWGVVGGLRGRPATLGQCISVAASRWSAIIGLAILTVLAVAVGYLLCIAPGFVLTCGLFLAGPVLIVEKLEPAAAMRRSWQLTDGFKSMIFTLAFAIFTLHFAASILLNLAFGVDAAVTEEVPDVSVFYQVLQDVVTVAFTAFNATAAGVAYHDLRKLREGLEEDALEGWPKSSAAG